MTGICAVAECSAFPDVQNGLILHAIPLLNDEHPEARFILVFAVNSYAPVILSVLFFFCFVIFSSPPR